MKRYLVSLTSAEVAALRGAVRLAQASDVNAVIRNSRSMESAVRKLAAPALVSAAEWRALDSSIENSIGIVTERADRESFLTSAAAESAAFRAWNKIRELVHGSGPAAGAVDNPEDRGKAFAGRY